MVQALINIPEETNRVLNIVKAKFGLKDKSQAIEQVVSKYLGTFLEPELRPEYVEKHKRIEKGKFDKYGSSKALKDEIDK
jgi:hypothetical protein